MSRYPLDNEFLSMYLIFNFIFIYSGLCRYYLVVMYGLYVLIMVPRHGVKSVDISSCFKYVLYFFCLSIPLRDWCDWICMYINVFMAMGWSHYKRNFTEFSVEFQVLGKFLKFIMSNRLDRDPVFETG